MFATAVPDRRLRCSIAVPVVLDSVLNLSSELEKASLATGCLGGVEVHETSQTPIESAVSQIVQLLAILLPLRSAIWRNAVYNQPAPAPSLHIPTMPAISAPPLNLLGYFYPAYKAANPTFDANTFSCAEKAVAKILKTATTSEHPGMLLGKVQSGKTRTFISILALAFDNGFDIAIVLSKNSRPLIQQTYNSNLRSIID